LLTPAGRFRLRLVAAALPQEALERAHQRVCEKARKKGRTPSQDNLFACGFILVLTNLPVASWSASQVLALYRLRWQVELLFKRYKSIFQLANLRARDPQLVQTYLLAKLLAALWADQLMLTTRELLPEWFNSLERPVSLWRLSNWVWAQLQRWVQGPITWTQILAAGPRLQRYLCDSPRRRPQQLASARSFLSRLSGC
jgi:IS4 transposase